MYSEKKSSYRLHIFLLVFLILLANLKETSGKTTKSSGRNHNNFEHEGSISEKGSSLLNEDDTAGKNKANRFKTSTSRKHSSMNDNLEDASINEQFNSGEVKNKIQNELVEPLIKVGELKKINSKELSSRENMKEKHLKSKRQELLNLLDAIIKKKTELEKKLQIELKNKELDGVDEEHDGEEEDSDENSNNSSGDTSELNDSDVEKTELNKPAELDAPQEKFLKDVKHKSKLNLKKKEQNTKNGYLFKREDKESSKITKDYNLDPLNKKSISSMQQKYSKKTLQKDNLKKCNGHKKQKFNNKEKNIKAMEDELMELYDNETNKRVLKKDLSRQNLKDGLESNEEYYYRAPLPRTRYNSRTGSRHKRRRGRFEYEDGSYEDDFRNGRHNKKYGRDDKSAESLPQVSSRRYKRQEIVLRPVSIKPLDPMYRKRRRSINSHSNMKRRPAFENKVQYIAEILPLKSNRNLPLSAEDESRERDISGENSYGCDQEGFSNEEDYLEDQCRYEDEMPYNFNSRYHCKRSISSVPAITVNNTNESINITDTKPIVPLVNVTESEINNVTESFNSTKTPENLKLENSTESENDFTDKYYRQYREAFLLSKQSNKIFNLLQNLESDKSVLSSNSEQSRYSSDSYQSNLSTDEDLSVQKEEILNNNSEDLSINQTKYLEILKKKEKLIKSLLKKTKTKRDIHSKLNTSKISENKQFKSKKYSRDSDPFMKKQKKNSKSPKILNDEKR